MHDGEPSATGTRPDSGGKPTAAEPRVGRNVASDGPCPACVELKRTAPDDPTPCEPDSRQIAPRIGCAGCASAVAFALAAPAGSMMACRSDIGSYGYQCTRVLRHGGSHVGHDTGNRAVAVWCGDCSGWAVGRGGWELLGSAAVELRQGERERGQRDEPLHEIAAGGTTTDESAHGNCAPVLRRPESVASGVPTRRGTSPAALGAGDTPASPPPSTAAETRASAPDPRHDALCAVVRHGLAEGEARELGLCRCDPLAPAGRSPSLDDRAAAGDVNALRALLREARRTAEDHRVRADVAEQGARRAARAVAALRLVGDLVVLSESEPRGDLSYADARLVASPHDAGLIGAIDEILAEGWSPPGRVRATALVHAVVLEVLGRVEVPRAAAAAEVLDVA